MNDVGEDRSQANRCKRKSFRKIDKPKLKHRDWPERNHALPGHMIRSLQKLQTQHDSTAHQIDLYTTASSKHGTVGTHAGISGCELGNTFRTVAAPRCMAFVDIA